jgi:hypothetical protein
MGLHSAVLLGDLPFMMRLADSLSFVLPVGLFDF